LVARVTRIQLKAEEDKSGAQDKQQGPGIARYLDVLQKQQSHPGDSSGTGTKGGAVRIVRDDDKLKENLEAEIHRRQQVTESLRQAEEEIKVLQQKVEQAQQEAPADAAEKVPGQEGANGQSLEEELRAKEAELNRIKMDYATKMKNSLALQRIKYEREIDNLRKEIRKLNMGREDVAEDLSRREKEIADREGMLKQNEMELAERHKKIESEAAAAAKRLDSARPSPVVEERIRNLENELLRQKTSLEVKSEALKRTEEKLTAKESELQEYMRSSDEQLKKNDLKVELDNVKKGSIAMMKYITSLQQKKQEEEFKAIRKALENEIQKRLQVEEELHKKEDSLAARQRALGAEIEKVATTHNVDLDAVRKLESELRMKEDELRGKEEAISLKEKALMDRIRGLEGEIQKKLRDGKILQDIKREFTLKEEELNLLRTELRQKEEDLSKRELEIGARVPASVSSNLQQELKRLKDELAFKDTEFKKLTEPIKYKEQEFLRREEDLRYREELVKKEAIKLEEARKEQATVDDSELKKRLEMLEGQVKAKEEEIKTRESYLRKKEEELHLRESKMIGKEVEAKEEELKLEIQTEKAKTGNPRLDDLLMGGVPFGSNVLCIGPAFIGKETLIDRFILEGLQKGIPALVITTDISPMEIREEMNYIVPGVEEFEKMGLLRYIDVYSKSMGIQEEDPYTLYVDHPTDYAGIQRAVEMLTKQFKEKNPTYRMAVRSISTLVTYSDPTSTYKFLQATTGRVKRAKVVSMYTMDRGMHSETEIQTLAHLMDGSIEFKTDGVKTFLGVQGLTDVQSRAWIQYTYTKKGLNIGSFALDHIR
jgi:KaiC/GvpD/RAD55 family RecA-like ATPase/DNA repair exonuclease SbcCD ATPase subunit